MSPNIKPNRELNQYFHKKKCDFSTSTKGVGTSPTNHVKEAILTSHAKCLKNCQMIQEAFSILTYVLCFIKLLWKIECSPSSNPL